MKGQLAPKMATKHREIMIFQFISSYTSWNIYLMIQRKDHFHSPSCGAFLSTLGFTLLATEQRYAFSVDGSGIRWVAGQSAEYSAESTGTGARRAPPIFWATYPRGSWGHPNNWWKVRESLPNPLISGLGVVGLGLRHVSDGLSNEGGRERF